MSSLRLGMVLTCLLLPVLAFAPAADAQGLRSPPGQRSSGASLVFAPRVPQPQGASDVVGLILRNVSSARLRNQPISFGQVFVAGKVPRGSGLTARINGSAAPAQMDAKAFNADGSARMAV